ncbi:D-alanine--D-alanine ligase [Clostridium sp. 'deep sea']|uniref:D-alanine--D-alanine ligase family protein n=1 Tax=Clostridium sp. 'deep sea' TaxID=2779445 RepID=UPI0018966682|nr:D-alanine--D-alanine ligase family protein [Clostridium sp. 'deep sea']QOR35830.1 D-alanine--D-alanine ligase [Clostridium sp. 'deep sea']
MNKQKVLIMFGGKSEEHEVSVSSAYSILNAIDKTKYIPATIGITKKGDFVANVDPGLLINNRDEVNINSKTWQNTQDIWVGDNWFNMINECDIIFPILHGPGGEDGTIQGLFDTLNKKYVGSGVTGSAICMDKSITKDVLVQAGIPVIPYIYFDKQEYEQNSNQYLTECEQFPYPLFVKPTCLGSSVGISKVKNKQQLQKAIKLAFQFGNRVIVEQGIIGREIECSVLGNYNPKASLPGEIIANADFYDYDTKYINDNAEYEIPANLTAQTVEQIKKISVESFKVLQCLGLARVDFFVEEDTNRVLLNEINTLPGFTPISMYPKLWLQMGLSYTDLITELLKLALEK